MVIPDIQSAMVLDKEVEFACSCKGNVTWIFNEGSLPSIAKARIDSNSSRAYLQISNIRQKFAGYYECVCDEDDLIYSDEGLLEVQGTG